MLKVFKVFAIVVITSLLFITQNLYSQTNDDCMACHSDNTLSKLAGGKTISLFVKENTLKSSVHRNVKCVGCHTDANVTEFPHPENLKEVNCGSCHKNAQSQFSLSIHGQALKFNAPYAPDCKECHGKHDVLSHTSPKSTTYKMNIPVLCGKCHKEGAPL